MALSAVQCAGTEADNPFVEQPAEVTACKGEGDYVSLRRALPTRQLESLEPQRTSQSSQALDAPTEIPAWLECVSWMLDEDELAVETYNFRGGCAITWEGSGFVTKDGALRLELSNVNPGCAVAGCGNCTYDARTRLILDETMVSSDLPLTVARLPCGGNNGEDSEWVLPLDERPSGTRCTVAVPDGASKADQNGAGRSDSLYAICTLDATPDPDAHPTPLTDCGEGHSCQGERCLPPCTDDADCPLDGALACQGGFCQLPL